MLPAQPVLHSVEIYKTFLHFFQKLDFSNNRNVIAFLSIDSSYILKILFEAMTNVKILIMSLFV